MSKTIFLIMADTEQQRPLAAELRTSGLFVNEYTTVREFFLDKENHKRGVVVSEVSLPGLSGMSLIESLAEERESFPLVLMPNRRQIGGIIQAGIEFIVKPFTAESIKDAVNWIVDPQPYDEKKLRWGFENLTERENQILQQVIIGKSSAQIAAEMLLNVNTVEALKASVNAKTRAKGPAELLRMWKAWKALE